MKIVSILFGLIILSSCSDYKYVDDDAFIGRWEAKGRSLYSGMEIRIIKEDGKLKGYITSPPSNKYGHLFLDSAKVWITDIKRNSNFEFEIKEQKIAPELFSLYGLETSSTFYATFSQNKNKINLTKEKTNSSKESTIYYQRIQK